MYGWGFTVKGLGYMNYGLKGFSENCMGVFGIRSEHLEYAQASPKPPTLNLKPQSARTVWMMEGLQGRFRAQWRTVEIVIFLASGLEGTAPHVESIPMLRIGLDHIFEQPAIW